MRPTLETEKKAEQPFRKGALNMKQRERPAGPMTARALLDNLEDAGCDSQFMECFLALEQSGQYREQLKLLSNHRRQLLDRLHREERRIDCLDYLVYQLEKRRAGES